MSGTNTYEHFKKAMADDSEQNQLTKPRHLMVVYYSLDIADSLVYCLAMGTAFSISDRQHLHCFINHCLVDASLHTEGPLRARRYAWLGMDGRNKP